jgi:hypothetical protein
VSQVTCWVDIKALLGLWSDKDLDSPWLFLLHVRFSCILACPLNLCLLKSSHVPYKPWLMLASLRIRAERS